MASDIQVIDYTPSKSKEAIEYRWWKLPDEELALHLVPLIKRMENRQYYRRIQNLRHARLYSNQELLALNAGLFSQPMTTSLQSHRVTLNVIKSCIDTAASKLSKAKPRPMFLTIDGDESLQRKAKALTKYMDGAFQAVEVYPALQRGFVDAALFGTGATKFYKEEDQIKCERAIIDQIFVDDAESIYGTPKQLHEVRYVSRDVLAELFPEHEAAIFSASSGLPVEFNANLQSVEMIRVSESWKLPSAQGAGDGRHAICIDGTTLHASEYTKNYFPFVFQRWNYKVTGFYGMGIAEELTGIQLEINKLLRTTQVAMHLMAVPRVFYDKNGTFDMTKLTNEVGGAYGFSGQPPIFNTAPAMPPEVYAHIENLYKKAFEIVGISMLSAASRKPSGLDSGVALREYQDIESDRFQLVGQRYEEAHLKAAEIIIDLTKELAEEGKDPYVKTKDGKSMKLIKWKEVDLKKDQYDMRVFPTSLLPTTPAGKLQTIQELTQAGFIDREMALSLLDFPDLDAYTSAATAAIDLTNKLIEKMIEKGEYEPPEAYEFIPLMKQMVQKAYLKAKLNSVPEERLELLRTFMSECQSLMEAMQPPQAPMQAQPQARPEVAPRSDLIPNLGVGV